MKTPNDLPRDQLILEAEKVVQEFTKNSITATVYFKFTCQKCNNRCMLAEPNVLYTHGECNCGTITEIKQGGFLLCLGKQ